VLFSVGWAWHYPTTLRKKCQMLSETGGDCEAASRADTPISIWHRWRFCFVFYGSFWGQCGRPAPPFPADRRHIRGGDLPGI